VIVAVLLRAVVLRSRQSLLTEEAFVEFDRNTERALADARGKGG
jgi:hypothetical protein